MCGCESFIWAWFHLIFVCFSAGVYIFGLFTTDIFVSAGQLVTGSLAPYFLSVCLPNYTALGCLDTANFVSQSDACTGDADDIMRARKTFPSKEAALSVYTAVYLAVSGPAVYLPLQYSIEPCHTVKYSSFPDVRHILCGIQWRSPDGPPPQPLIGQCGYAHRHQQNGRVPKPLEWCHRRTSHRRRYRCLSGLLSFILFIYFFICVHTSNDTHTFHCFNAITIPLINLTNCVLSNFLLTPHLCFKS